MAKISLINREEKRASMVKKYAAKRAELKAAITNVQTSDEDRMARTRHCSSCHATPVRFVCVIVAS